jgi:FKBP-type peptidyl-prolyl cis-trans isomerase
MTQGKSKSEIKTPKGDPFMKNVLLVALLALATVAVVAQSSAAKKKSSASAASGPSKVTGAPTKTADGLEYWDIKQGTGKTAQKGDTVLVNYTGWFTDGKKFDSSIGRGPFKVEQLGNAPVIKGWNEGIVGMKEGGKRQLRIPPALAYGPGGYPGVIPPNSTLIFDVELLKVQ